MKEIGLVDRTMGVGLFVILTQVVSGTRVPLKVI